MTIEFSNSASRFQQEFDGESFDHYLPRYIRYYNSLSNKDSAYRIEVIVPQVIYSIYDHMFSICVSKKLLTSRRKLLSALVYYGYIILSNYLNSNNLTTKHFFKFREIIDIVGGDALFYDFSGSSALYSDYPSNNIVAHNVDRSNKIKLHIMDNDTDVLSSLISDLGFYTSHVFLVYLAWGIENAINSDSFLDIKLYKESIINLSKFNKPIRYSLHNKILSTMNWSRDEFQSQCIRLIHECDDNEDLKTKRHNKVNHLFKLAKKM